MINFILRLFGYGNTTHKSQHIPKPAPLQEKPPPKYMLLAKENLFGYDTKVFLESLGFIILGDESITDSKHILKEFFTPIFYQATPPNPQWRKTTIDQYKTAILDEMGHERFQQYHNGKFYDRVAYLIIPD